MIVTNTDYCPICGSFMLNCECLQCGFHEKPLRGYYKSEHPQAVKKRAMVHIRGEIK